MRCFVLFWASDGFEGGVVFEKSGSSFDSSKVMKAPGSFYKCGGRDSVGCSLSWSKKKAKAPQRTKKFTFQASKAESNAKVTVTQSFQG